MDVGCRPQKHLLWEFRASSAWKDSNTNILFHISVITIRLEDSLAEGTLHPSFFKKLGSCAAIAGQEFWDWEENRQEETFSCSLVV